MHPSILRYADGLGATPSTTSPALRSAMLPSWNSLHTLLVARAVLLWHGASYPMLRCSSLARHRILYVPALPTVAAAHRVAALCRAASRLG